MNIRASMVTHLTQKEVTSAKSKAVWYDIVFSNEDEGVMGLKPDQAPPEVGQTISYSLEVVKTAAGKEINKIEWPLPPALRQPGEVVAPITNPVEESKTEPAEVKAPEKVLKAPDRDHLIVRQVAIKSAVDYYAQQQNNPEDPRFQIKAMAEWIEQWIFRGVEQ